MMELNAVSTVAGLKPKADTLKIGQLGLNSGDGKIYLKLNNNRILCVGWNIEYFATTDQLSAAIAGIQPPDLSPYAINDDVVLAINNLAASIQALGASLQGQINQKAATVHGHGIAEIAQLGATLSTMQSGINGKQPAGSYAPLPGVTGGWSCQTLIASNYIQAGTNSTFRIGTDVVARVPNRNGWQSPTGPKSTAAFNTAAVTLPELAKRVAAMIDELRWHGLLSQYGNTL
jgi:hypothetical protein